ncbi:DUF58 domain-containing protein [Pseudoclavibacter endophyticus]|uniref:DUF58 domain-containing protein n=1 Tax=Pseudoclavibacter endophyticus TaxID=1778590 RepID=A0A6H9WN58_9MICO|nr:DUF58 domain-containing protein [Pseudoclavibacter endophyticus]KAB1649141.1 DUF58 domain-containing protein [Pseudoclavibacter endophyticus]
MPVSGRFVALLAAGLVPLVLFGTTSSAALWILGGWLALALLMGVIDTVLAASPRRVRIERDVPRQVRLGEQATSVLAVTNAGTRTLRATVRDAWDPSAGAPRMRERISIPPSERRALRSTLSPTRRGERRAHHVTIRSWGPMGLWARQATLAAPGRLLVLPPFNSRKHLPSRLAKLRELDGQTQLMVRGHGTEFDSLREYVRGDDVRSIDWRATARRQDLVVRTWRPERDRRVVILVDAGRLSAARVDDEVRLDTAIESSLLLAALATRAGDRVDLLAFDRRVRGRVQGASGPTLTNRIVETLADVEPELIETDWTLAPGLVRGVTTHRSLVLIVTTPDAAGSATSLLDVLPQLTRKHVVLVASVVDPEVWQATRDRSDREAVYRAASAERVMLDRARLHQAMRRFGADVIEARPADLPPAVADRYLEYKRAGKL